MDLFRRVGGQKKMSHDGFIGLRQGHPLFKTYQQMVQDEIMRLRQRDYTHWTACQKKMSDVGFIRLCQGHCPWAARRRCWIYWAVSGALPLGSQKKMSEENATSIAATIEEWVGKIPRLCQGGAPSFQSLPADVTRWKYETGRGGDTLLSKSPSRCHKMKLWDRKRRGHPSFKVS